MIGKEKTMYCLLVFMGIACCVGQALERGPSAQEKATEWKGLEAAKETTKSGAKAVGITIPGRLRVVVFGACTETIAVNCVKGGSEAEFEVVSDVFGKLGTAIVGKPFTDDPRHPADKRRKLDSHLRFTVKPGARSFETGDAFTLDLQSYRFWVQGKNPEPSYKYLTHLSYCEAPPASRRMGGWGRIEIEPEVCNAEDHFLTVMYCSGGEVPEMPTKTALIREDGVEGVKLSQGDREYEVRFRSTGTLGGRLKISGKDRILVDRDLAGSVEKEFKPAP